MNGTLLRQDQISLGANAKVHHLNFYNMDRAPMATDDLTVCAAVSSLWFNSVNNDLYMCTDPTTSNAVWVQIN